MRSQRLCNLAAASLLIHCLAHTGCSKGSSSSDGAVEIDVDQAAAKAIADLDASKDGALDAQELAASTPLAKYLANYDADGDGKITEDEIVARLTRLYNPPGNVTFLDCTVTYQGRPLSGADVKLRPAAMFGESLPEALGTTDGEGLVRPSVAADALPAKYQAEKLLYPGLYHVEVTHPSTKLPPRFNTESELSWEVDPAARGGLSPRFDLKAN